MSDRKKNLREFQSRLSERLRLAASGTGARARLGVQVGERRLLVELAEAGEVAPLPPAGWHLMGTARMGRDPETSVVNEWGRSHDVKNLFVIDGSIFVTSGAVNPTNTIQALSLYVADAIKKNLANLFD